MANLFTVQDFFGGIFIDSYVFAMKDGGGQYKGSMPTQFCNSRKEINDFFEENYFNLNREGYGIHFTPNGIKSLEEKNRKHNLSHINAWFVDIDIKDSKHIKDEADIMHREDMKENILGKIFRLDILPSLTVETRNGFHLYWFALPLASVAKFETIQSKLVNLFEDVGGDIGAMGALHSLRVPYFKYYKDGEEGFVTPIEIFSTLKLYKEKDMLDWLEVIPEHKTTKPAGSRRIANRMGPKLDDTTVYTINVRHGIFNRAEEHPVKTILEKLSGTTHVRSEIFSFQRTGENKLNLLSNGLTTPNWIDEKENRIFSNNQPNFCVIHHFLAWYGHNNKQIAQIYYELGL